MVQQQLTTSSSELTELNLTLKKKDGECNYEVCYKAIAMTEHVQYRWAADGEKDFQGQGCRNWSTGSKTQSQQGWVCVSLGVTVFSLHFGGCIKCVNLWCCEFMFAGALLLTIMPPFCMLGYLHASLLQETLFITALVCSRAGQWWQSPRWLWNDKLIQLCVWVPV